ncbi:MAG TPA: hypothetical protein VK705_07160 [Ferruginibacter sp.]|jgi:hypothetical protein|nr:hypothetical protein [Ferruginibacter sp.]
MGTVKIYRLRGNTILETIVALVIIITIFGTATTLFVKVAASSTSMQKLTAENILKTYAIKTEEQKLFFTDEEEINGYRVKREVTAMDNLKNMTMIHFYIFDQNNKLLSDWQQLISTK